MPHCETLPVFVAEEATCVEVCMCFRIELPGGLFKFPGHMVTSTVPLYCQVRVVSFGYLANASIRCVTAHRLHEIL